MWPLYVSQLVTATTPDAAPLVPLDDTLGRQTLSRAVAWANGDAGERDVLFVVERAMHGDVKSALERGAIAVVPEGFPSAERPPALTRRVLVSKNPVGAFRRFAAFMRSRLFVPTIAVGGSNGKTTTKEMIVAALSGDGRRITATPGTNNGWIGVPITLCHPWHTDPLPDALVLEIGIDEQGAMQEHVTLARPNIAVLTALGVEHLAGLGSHEDAIREELELFQAPRRIWLADEPALAARLDEVRDGDMVVHDRSRPVAVRCPTLAYAWRRRDENGELDVHVNGESVLIPVPMPGAHNGRNAALAIATAVALGRTLEQAKRGFASFAGPKQRCVVMRLPSGCVLIDDTYNASPSSVDAALDVLASIEPERPRLIVLGDMLDLGDASTAEHAGLIPKLDRIANAHVRLYGREMSALAPSLESALSIAHASSSIDPTALVDVAGLEAHVILIKGSRGMRLERVVEHVKTREGEPKRLEIAVTGTERASVTEALRAALDPIARVRSLSTEDLTASGQGQTPFDLAILATFAPREDEDAEQSLATIAQLFVHLDANAGAVLARTDAEDEAPELLLSVIPGTSPDMTRPATRPLTRVATSKGELISTAISVAHELDRRKAAGTR